MISYKKSGVDVKASDKFTEFLQKKSKAIGGFAGLYNIKGFAKDSSIVASTDGVGTKLKLAFILNKHDSIGIDLVAMCVNDLITVGAKPLFFLDYYATGKLKLEKSKQIIAGIMKGCEQSSMLLLGGETAEMPGFYLKDEYDLAGFAVGIVENKRVIDGSSVKDKDIVVGLKSSGFHSNGYSLIRKVMKKSLKLKKAAKELLKPTKIYVRDIERLRSALAAKGSDIKALAHITGSGIKGNLERVIPDGLSALVYRKNWRVPKLFNLLAAEGRISEKEMFDTFNMGIGMILVLSAKDLNTAKKILPDCLVLGEIVKGAEKTKIIQEN